MKKRIVLKLTLIYDQNWRNNSQCSLWKWKSQRLYLKFLLEWLSSIHWKQAQNYHRIHKGQTNTTKIYLVKTIEIFISYSIRISLQVMIQSHRSAIFLKWVSLVLDPKISSRIMQIQGLVLIRKRVINSKLWASKTYWRKGSQSGLKTTSIKKKDTKTYLSL